MRKSTIALVSISLFLAFPNAPILAHDGVPGESDPVVRELAGIRQSLDDLVNLVAAMQRGRDADLILRRLEMYERRLAPIEKQLEGNKREQLDTATSTANIEEWMTQTQERIDEVEREGREEVPIDLAQELRMAEQSLERDRVRLETLQQQQIELENAIADRRDDIEILEDLLEELLQQ